MRSVDLSPAFEDLQLTARRQGSRGTCSVFAVTAAIEYALTVHSRRGVRLSVEFLNWAAHRALDRHEDGGFFSELWKGYLEYGICSEDHLPYAPRFDDALQPGPEALQNALKYRSGCLELRWIKEWDVETGLTDEHIEQLKRTIDRGWPVCAGLRWPRQAVWTDDVLQMCTPEQVFDGHSIVLIGYEEAPVHPGGGLFRIRNSGGETSDGYLTFEYVRAYTNDAAVIEATR